MVYTCYCNGKGKSRKLLPDSEFHITQSTNYIQFDEQLALGSWPASIYSDVHLVVHVYLPHIPHTLHNTTVKPTPHDPHHDLVYMSSRSRLGGCNFVCIAPWSSRSLSHERVRWFPYNDWLACYKAPCLCLPPSCTPFLATLWPCHPIDRRCPRQTESSGRG